MTSNARSIQAKIFYRDIGDYLSREQKLAKIAELRSVLNPVIEWTELQPNEHGDWLNQRNDAFSQFIPLAPEKKFDAKAQAFFTTYAIGVSTNRDAWVYNFSKTAVEENMRRMIDFYNQQSAAYAKAKKKQSALSADDFIDTNPANISWTVNLKKDFEKEIAHNYKSESIVPGQYRPFSKQHLYYDREFIERPGLWSQLFPTPQHENIIICVSGIGTTKDFTVLLTDKVPCLDIVEKGQCFPRYWYDEPSGKSRSLFDKNTEYTRREGVSDFILGRARQQYGTRVTKEDIFYYVYGFLHSPDYRKTFANDLKKMLPRLPLVDKPTDFWAFSKAGRQLAELHLNYETVPPCPGVTVTGAESKLYTVEKMRFAAKDRKDTIVLNSSITVSGIPPAAYAYVVNGKSAIEWVMERYQVKTDKDSGIKNDPNDWAREHGKPRYILDLLLSVINVSVQTVEIVETLPKVTFGLPEVEF